MKLDDIKTIAVVGAGNMGRQIAMAAALAGYDVFCTDLSEDMLGKAKSFAKTYLSGRVAKERLTQADADIAANRLTFTLDLAEAVRDADYVIEAVVEKLDVKRQLFADLGRLAPSHAILASNSSAIVSSKFADVTGRPDKVVNLHFFNPALVMKLVEVVQGPHVSDQTAQISMALCRRLGKEPVHLKKEVEGFLLNRIFGAIQREAFWLLEMGVASHEDIDKACVYGAGHPMGPFRLNDLTGLDLLYTIMIENFQASGDFEHLPPPTLTAHYLAGEYGEKTGKGWYDYSKAGES